MRNDRSEAALSARVAQAPVPQRPVKPNVRASKGARAPARLAQPQAAVVLEDADAPDHWELAPVPVPAQGTSVVEAIAAFVALALVGSLLLAMLTLVTRFLRGTWSP